MKRLTRFLAALTCVWAVAAGTTVAAANADPSNAATWTFTGCTGPAGTPTTFTASRLIFAVPNGSLTGQVQPIWLLTGGTETFQAFAGTNLDTGFSFGSGTGMGGLLTVTCYTTSPVSGYRYVYTGFLTPIGPH